MNELMMVHPLNDDMTDAEHIYILTKDGSDYNQEGLEYVESVIRESFDTKMPLVAFTGVALNSPKTLKACLEKHPGAYVVTSTKDDVLFLPPRVNPDICANLDELLAEDSNITSWEVLMKSCKCELY